MRAKSYLPRNIHGKKCTKDTIKSIETDDFMKYNKKSLNEDDDEAMTIAIHCVLDAYDDIWNEDYLFETTEWNICNSIGRKKDPIRLAEILQFKDPIATGGNWNKQLTGQVTEI